MTLHKALGMTAEEAIDRVLWRARGYVDIETPSFHEAGIIELSEKIEHDLQQIGLTVERHDAPGRGRNLVARLPGREEVEPLLLLAHIDTVHPLGTLAARPFALKRGKAYAPGIYDMKTGVALLVESLLLLKERGTRPRRPVIFLVTCDEEVGSVSSRPLIKRYAAEAGAALVPEPCLPDGGIKTSRKGVATYTVRTFGRGGHAGLDPGITVSAIAELVEQCSRILTLARHELGTTINVGTIKGGTASNVVADEAMAMVDVRLQVADETERIHAALTSLQPIRAEARVEVTASERRPPLVRSPEIVALYQQAHAIARELGVQLTEGLSGGGSDGSLAASWGAPTLDGLGPLGAGAHATNEHIVVADLPFRLAFISRLMERL